MSETLNQYENETEKFLLSGEFDILVNSLFDVEDQMEMRSLPKEKLERMIHLFKKRFFDLLNNITLSKDDHDSLAISAKLFIHSFAKDNPEKSYQAAIISYVHTIVTGILTAKSFREQQKEKKQNAR